MIEKKRLIEAVKNTILLSACTHLVIIAITAIARRDITMVNYFNILDFDFFFPTIAQGTMSQIIALVFTLGLIGIMYYFSSSAEK